MYENMVRTGAGVVDVKPLSFSAAVSVLIGIMRFSNKQKFMRLWDRQHIIGPVS